MLVKILASGSSGNSCFVKTNELNFLIDAGITKKKIEEALNKINESVINLDYIFLTHEHIDHVKGLLMVLKYSKAKVYLTLGTLEELLKNQQFYNFYINEEMRFNVLERINNIYETIHLVGLTITPLEAFHDAKEPVGYLFEEGNKKIVYLTDTGYIHQDVLGKIANCDCYIFETNHDPEILMNSTRPYQLKMRILSDYGHLSNADSIYALAKLVGDKTKYIFCAHISQECNLREIIALTYKRIFQKLGVNDSNIKMIMTLPTDIEEVTI